MKQYDMEIRKIKAKSILSKSQVYDYALNLMLAASMVASIAMPDL